MILAIEIREPLNQARNSLWEKRSRLSISQSINQSINQVKYVNGHGDDDRKINKLYKAASFERVRASAIYTYGTVHVCNQVRVHIKKHTLSPHDFVACMSKVQYSTYST